VTGYGESDLPEHRSFATALSGWASREDGVYATEDGGASWRLVYRRNAVRVARVSAAAGMIAVGDRVSRCGCRQARLWTADGGVTWHRTQAAVGGGFVGSAGTLWWWRRGRLYRAAEWPPGPKGLRPRHAAHLPGVIVDADPVPDGVAALVTRRTSGLGLDNSPQLLLVQGGSARVLRLPRVPGDVLAQSVEASWPTLEVRALDTTAFARGERGSVTWTSTDGGETWAAARS
jgi:hypothetical protein